MNGPEVYREYESESTIVLKPPESFTRPRLWVVPRVEDYSQSEFELVVQNCAAVNILLSQLKTFASRPLSPINVDAFVRFLSRVDSRLPHVSADVPFDISGDRATKTHCSESTLQRITSDVRKYAQKTNAEAVPTLIGFSSSDVESFHQSPNVLFKAQTQINNLITSLYTAMDFDRKSLWNLMQRALAIACSDERSDSPNTGSIDGETNFLLFRFGQCSEREPSVWFELLVASILSSTSEHDIRMLNPFTNHRMYFSKPRLK